MEDHCVGLVAMSIVSIITFFIGLVVNCSRIAVQFSAVELIPQLFEETEANATTNYKLPVTTELWTEAMWIVVYICQIFWLVYALTAICRQTPSGPVYNHPKLLPVTVHIFFVIAVIQQTAWLILYHRNFLALSLLVIVLSAACSLISLSEALRQFDIKLSGLVQEFRNFDIWAVRIFAHNALALLTVWLTLNATLNLVLALVYYMDSKTSGNALAVTQLSILAFVIVTYTAFDIFALDRWTRYVLTPYLAIIIFLAGLLHKDWPSLYDPIFLFLAVLQSLSFLFILVKVVVMSFRHTFMFHAGDSGNLRPLLLPEERKYAYP
ncbi:hypothetical protein C0Q70_03001 [Pomacea canaliculata]|uniref:Uncharacterized protein n=2 Tax=Pomacea canaliculata TaxID=400727 RepID=A0A2T7PRH7_POMCA|nr:hypothetical protein C0Q70_03001 [Pomacea canaliculata]